MKEYTVQLVNIEKLIPYENNPRNNQDAINGVAASIREFGFKQPILITEENVIVTGHTRRLAAMQLGLQKVPCIVINDLSEDRIDAYRLADNKVAEVSQWNMKALNDELFKLNKINDLDMSQFGFDALMKQLEDLEIEVDEIDESQKVDEGYYGDERENTFNTYNLYEFDYIRSTGYYDMPTLEKTEYIPESLKGFNYVLSTKEKDDKSCIHFYLDDYQFERIWNRPHFYIDKIKENFRAALTPDFSLYLDMPIAMKVWNIYRSRLIGQLMQDAGLEVIPTISWAEEETFEFAFDGIPQGSIISVSTIGVKRDEEGYNIWVDGMNEALNRLKPEAVIVYGGKLEGYDFKETKVFYMENEVTKRWKNEK